MIFGKPSPKRILISFCNTPPYLEMQKKGISSLALLDVEREEVYWIKLPRETNCGGITGLSQDRRYIVAAFQAEKPGVIVFDKKLLG